jgi:type IV pilus assembly protein PilY1
MTHFRFPAAWLLLVVIASCLGLTSVARASAISSATQRAAAYAIDPPLGIAGAAPLVMLNLSRDHQLFYKAYNDFTDLTGDGSPETTYTTTFGYVGYFDPTKCYAYSSSSGYFVPQAAVVDATNHYCSNSLWSGNFLNWATMTRMDEVRKILYGGLRSQDDTTTVLERAYLPTDAHSFAKYYNGSDIGKLTPYSPSSTAPSASLASASYYYDDVAFTENSTNYRLLRLQRVQNSLKVQVGDQIQITANNSTGSPATLIAPVRYLNTSGYSGAPTNRVELRLQDGMFFNMSCTDVPSCITQLKSYSNWTITNLTRTGLSICNTTVQGSSTNRSQTNTAPPLIRVQTGNYALWASNESLQCLWAEEKSNSQGSFGDGFLSNGNRAAFSGLGSAAENPTKANGTQGTDWDELIARVQVCVAGQIGAENCKQYPDNTSASNPYKPIGLLQKYAETGNIKFGLVTPTFDHNASGGVVRAALPGPGQNDGDFISNEIDANTGRMIAGAKGIISNINALRIYGYAYLSGDNYGTGNGCTYQRTGITTGTASGTLVSEGNCSSWGNPMAESYIETLRYLAGKTPNAAFKQNTSGEDATLGLSVVTTWNDPVSAANFCAPLNIINFNASSLSYDTDAVDGFSDLTSGKTVQTWTDLVGVGEGINGNSWFVGNSSSTYAGTDANLCSAKVIANLSAAQGICPEVPALKGGYLLAGAAYGAHVMRIRDLGNDSGGNVIVPTEDRTSLKVTTFGVQLATNTPQIRIAVPGTKNQFVTIIPSYRLTLPTGVGGGALVDFKILSQTNDGTTARGSFYADWEDSFAGGDYDQDMWGIISYEITATQVKITTKPVSASTNNGQGFGYVINGTTKDGPHFHSGIYSFSYTDPTSPDIYNAAGVRLNGTGRINASGGCNGCVVSDAATTAIYAVGSSNAGTLSDPLLYAAKWGGFRADTNKPDGTDTPVNDSNPADTSKWSTTVKGTPDNYFLVTDPGKLETSLDTLFRKILAKISSGTAAATVAASANGVGVTYQAFYEAERTDTSGDRATWAGSLGALWTDAAGLLREDANGNNQLDDYATDPVVQFSYQAGSGRTVATRTFTSSPDPTKYTPGTPVTVELADLKTLWNARQQLWDPGMSITQRPYSTLWSSTSGRYIFTWVDANGDGIVQPSEIRPFIWSTGDDGINASNYRYLNTDSTTEAANIVNWIRGQEITGLRNRTVDFDNTPGLIGRVLRLGDIVNSTPLPVSAPAESYDLLYNDSSYASFRTAYRDRRQVVYVGANDGMLHAFNAGFYNASCQRFTLQPTNAVCTKNTPNATGAATATPVAQPLGAELWAYVPKNLLAHLRWLTDPSYKHTYYVDGAPLAFDAKIFAADTTHVGGWGTLLLVPFRLGGGSITVDTSTSGPSNNVTSDSAYVLMDVTNPEVPPTLLGEITLPGTYALSVPAVAVVRDAASGSPNKFFLAVGSGPTDPRKVASNQNLRVSIYDLASFVGATTAPAPVRVLDFGSSSAGQNSFAGDLIASDFNLDGKAEAIYFGSVLGTGSSADYGGHFWRIAVGANPAVSAWTGGQMLNLTVASIAPNGMPVTVRPTLGRNTRGAPMVYFGTGRLYNSSDKATTAQQRIFGLIDTSLLPANDPQYSATIGMSNLVDVTNVNVFPPDSVGVSKVTNAPTNTSFTGVTTFAGLAAAFDSKGVAGWYRNLTTNGTNPSERVVSAQSLLGGLLLTAAYTPGTSICTGLGASVLYGQNYQTGTGDPNAFFGSNTPNGAVAVSSPIGAGLPAPPSLHTGDDTSAASGSKKVTACTQTSTGAILCKDVATLKAVTSGEASWREPLGK